MIGLIVVAALYKLYQVREASRWPSVPGKVVVSQSQMRRVNVSDSITRTDGTNASEERNFANVVFEYHVGSRRFRNDRVSIGEDLGNFQVAETLAKYPVGRDVVVFYNPRDPKQSVLERDAPKGVWGCIGALLTIGVAMVLGAFYGFNQLGLWVVSQLPQGGHASAAAAFGIFGGVIALFAALFQWQAAKKKSWPTAPGKIVESSVEEFSGYDRDDDSSSGRQVVKTYYRSHLVYSYIANGITYHGNAANAGGQMTSTMRGIAQKQADKYKPGQAVRVHFNPDNPVESVLDPRAFAIWIIWLAALAVFGAAYYAATH